MEGTRRDPIGLDPADDGTNSDMHFAGARPSAVAHSPRPGRVHHGADAGLGRGRSDGAAGVQDEATDVAEQRDELTRFRFDERRRRARRRLTLQIERRTVRFDPAHGDVDVRVFDIEMRYINPLQSVADADHRASANMHSLGADRLYASGLLLLFSPRQDCVDVRLGNRLRRRRHDLSSRDRPYLCLDGWIRTNQHAGR